jgi:hypothetical protein
LVRFILKNLFLTDSVMEPPGLTKLVELRYNLDKSFSKNNNGQTDENFGLSISVPRTGFEPAHPCERCHLKAVRLPISPSGQAANVKPKLVLKKLYLFFLPPNHYHTGNYQYSTYNLSSKNLFAQNKVCLYNGGYRPHAADNGHITGAHLF